MTEMMTFDRLLLLLGLTFFVAGFGQVGHSADENPGPPDADRVAILAMAGEHEVVFNFEEEVSLQEGYKLTDEYNEEANELVLVVEDTPTKIALQHILLTGNGNRIVKHWSQIWTWEDERIIEFQGRNKWIVKDVDPALVKGTWSQLVTQVDDSPRYESFGKWDHSGGYARWESLPTARPLPRREHTKRDDYQILLGVNSHSITPHGWVHGQDNLKQVVSDSGEVVKFIAREDGLNYYDKTEDTDFSKAREYWKATSEFWMKVSGIWAQIEENESAFSIAKGTKEVSLMKDMFKIASDIQEEGKPVPDTKEIEAAIRKHLSPAKG